MKGQFAMTKGGAETFYCVYPVESVRFDLFAEVWLKTFPVPMHSPCHSVLSDAQSMSPCPVRCTVMSDAECHVGCTAWTEIQDSGPESGPMLVRIVVSIDVWSVRSFLRYVLIFLRRCG